MEFSGGKWWKSFDKDVVGALSVDYESCFVRFLWFIGRYSEGIILSSSNDFTLKFWDYNLNMAIHSLEGHKH